MRALVVNGDPAEKYMPAGIEIVHGDLLDKESLECFFKTDEDEEVYVIHCAGIVWVKVEANPAVHAVNVGGTANIIDQCIRHGVKKLVYISSIGAIPELPAGQKIRRTLNTNQEESTARIGGIGTLGPGTANYAIGFSSWIQYTGSDRVFACRA